jgi:hypothetical protein
MQTVLKQAQDLLQEWAAGVMIYAGQKRILDHPLSQLTAKNVTKETAVRQCGSYQGIREIARKRPDFLLQSNRKVPRRSSVPRGALRGRGRVMPLAAGPSGNKFNNSSPN